MISRHRNLHLALASSLAVAFIVSAYVFTGPFSFRPSTVDAATAQSLLKSYASKDSDSDGLPDWQEALYGTDPANPESVKIGVKDGDAVAQGLVKPRFVGAGTPLDQSKNSEKIPTVADNTITAQFARSFFTDYLNTYGGSANLTDEQLSAFTEKAVAKLVSQRVQVDAYTTKNVKVAGTGPDALRLYAQQVTTALTRQTLTTDKSEIDYLSDALERNDASALIKISEIGKSYTAMSKLLIAVPAPSEAASVHLKMANTLSALGTIITDISTSSTDPLRSLLGLMLYGEASTTFTRSLSEMFTVFTTARVSLQSGEGGFPFFGLVTFAHDTLTK